MWNSASAADYITKHTHTDELSYKIYERLTNSYNLQNQEITMCNL